MYKQYFSVIFTYYVKNLFYLFIYYVLSAHMHMNFRDSPSISVSRSECVMGTICPLFLAPSLLGAREPALRGADVSCIYEWAAICVHAQSGTCSIQKNHTSTHVYEGEIMRCRISLHHWMALLLLSLHAILHSLPSSLPPSFLPSIHSSSLLSCPFPASPRLV